MVERPWPRTRLHRGQGRSYNSPLFFCDYLIVSQLQMLYHQDTKGTKFHQEKQDVNFVFLGAFGVLVVRFLSLIQRLNTFILRWCFWDFGW